MPDIIIDEDEALRHAERNRSDIISFQRRKKVVERNVVRAKGETGITASIIGIFGLSQTG